MPIKRHNWAQSIDAWRVRHETCRGAGLRSMVWQAEESHTHGPTSYLVAAAERIMPIYRMRTAFKLALWCQSQNCWKNLFQFSPPGHTTFCLWSHNTIFFLSTQLNVQTKKVPPLLIAARSSRWTAQGQIQNKLILNVCANSVEQALLKKTIENN